MLLHVKPHGGFDLPPSRGLLTRHWEDQANLDGILGNYGTAGARRSNCR
jgi:hypothetical protein